MRTVVAELRRAIEDPDGLSIPELDRKLPGHSATSVIKTLAESEGARSSPRQPRKAPPPFLPIQTTETGLDSSLFRRAQARSKRSWSITLVHATTKSFTNLSLES